MFSICVKNHNFVLGLLSEAFLATTEVSRSRYLQRKYTKAYRQRKREHRMLQQQLEIKSELETGAEPQVNFEHVAETNRTRKTSTHRVRAFRMRQKWINGVFTPKGAPKTSLERTREYRMRKKLKALMEAEESCEFVPETERVSQTTTRKKLKDEVKINYEIVPNECIVGGTIQNSLLIVKQEPDESNQLEVKCSTNADPLLHPLNSVPLVDSGSFCASQMEPMPSTSGIKQEPDPEITTPALDGFFGHAALWDSLRNVPDPVPDPDQDRLPRGRKNPTVTLDSIKKDLTYECELCGRRFRKSADFFQHKLTHGEELKCGDCDERFFKSWDLEKHRIHKHSDTEIYKCELCSKIFIEHWKLLRHQRTHSTDKKFQCDSCDKCFTESGNLAKHKKQVHTKDRPFSCEICSKSYPQKKDLQGHMLVHSIKRFSCNICSEEFSMLDEKRKHVRNVHPNEPTERWFTCTVCEATFNSKLKHSNHVLTHGERRFECQVCLKKFHTNARVRKHMNSHRVENHSKCHICNKSFSQDCNLKRHIEQMHMLGDRYSCQHCTSLFDSADELKTHRELEHQNELPYKCPACPKAFSCHQSLVNHTRCHKNPKRHLQEFIKPTPRKRKQPKTEGEKTEAKKRGRPKKKPAEATVTTSSELRMGPEVPSGMGMYSVEMVPIKSEVDHFEDRSELLSESYQTVPTEMVMLPVDTMQIKVEQDSFDQQQQTDLENSFEQQQTDLDGSELLTEIKIEDTGFNGTTTDADFYPS